MDCGQGVSLDITPLSAPGQNTLTGELHPTSIDHVVGYPSATISGGMPAALAIRSVGDDLLFPLRLREHTEYEVAIEFPEPYDVVRKRMQAAGSSWPFLDSVVNERVWHVHRPDNWPQTQRTGSLVATRVIGVLNFKTHIGVVNLSVTPARTVRAEVVPAKLDYESDFRKLLFELSDLSTALVLHLEGVSTTALTLEESTDDAYRTQILHLRRLMGPDQLPAAVGRILTAPHELLKSELAMEPLALARDVDLPAIPSHISECAFRKGGPLKSSFGGFTSSELPVRHKHITQDTPENRFVKYGLQRILLWLYEFSAAIPINYDVTKRAVLDWALQVQNWLRATVLRDVGEMNFLPLSSVVLQQRAGYREFLRAYLSFALGLRLRTAGTDMAELAEGNLRPIHRLYEYWCFLKMAEIVERVCDLEGVVARALIQTEETGWELKLASNERSRIVFHCRKPEMQIEMWYNRDFTLDEFEMDSEWGGAYTGLFHPDISLRITLPGGLTHWIHFDAKYRLDRHKWLALFQKPRNILKDNEHAGVFERGDLYTMHAYRDAILGSRGSYVLYPGPVAANRPLFVRNPVKSYRMEYSIPSVGAFPLTPVGFGVSATQEKDLEDFLRSLLAEIASAAGYQEELGLRSPTRLEGFDQQSQSGPPEDNG